VQATLLRAWHAICLAVRKAGGTKPTTNTVSVQRRLAYSRLKTVEEWGPPPEYRILIDCRPHFDPSRELDPHGTLPKGGSMSLRRRVSATEPGVCRANSQSNDVARHQRFAHPRLAEPQASWRCSLVVAFVILLLPHKTRAVDCLYMVDVFSGPLLVVRTDDFSVTEVPLGLAAFDIVVTGRIGYVGYRTGGFPFPREVVAVDLWTGAMSPPIPIGNAGSDMKIARGKLYVASGLSERLDVIELSSHNTTQVEGFRFPVRLSAMPDESALFVGCQTGRVDKLDTTTDTVVDGIRIPGGVASLYTDGNVVLVGGTNGLQVFDTEFVEQGPRIFEGFFIADVIIHSGRTYASTRMSFGSFLIDDFVVDLEPNRFLPTDYNDVRVSDDGRTAYVSGPSKLFVVDTERRRVTRVLETGGNYTSMELAPCLEAPPPSATATATPQPSSTATHSPTPSNVSTQTPTASPSPSSSNTPTVSPTVVRRGGDDGCAIATSNSGSASSVQVIVGLLAIVFRVVMNSKTTKRASIERWVSLLKGLLWRHP